MNGNERSVQKMNGIARNVLNGNERDAQPCFKGTVSRDFLAQTAYIIHLQISSLFMDKKDFARFCKLAEIFALLSRVGHRVHFRSEHSVHFRSFFERNVHFRSFFEFLATYETPPKNYIKKMN